MAKQQQRQFLFTNENLYDQNIFGRIYPQFIEALQENNLKRLHKIVESYYYLTQHFYIKHSDDIEERLYGVYDDLSLTRTPQKKSDLIKKAQVETAVKVELRQIWKEISNHLHNNDYFKKSYAINNNQLALPTKQ